MFQPRNVNKELIKCVGSMLKLETKTKDIKIIASAFNLDFSQLELESILLKKNGKHI